MPMKMTPKQWADGLKLLAERKKRRAPRSIAVQVLKRAILASPGHRGETGWSERGDITVIADGWYVRKLEGKGVVTRDIQIPIFPTRN